MDRLCGSTSASPRPVDDHLCVQVCADDDCLSRAVVVNSNMSRGKYLAREGPGSRLSKPG